MSKLLSEKQVLRKLKIDDFRQLTKDKVIKMSSMLDKMDPEVAKKALEQFPDFSETMKEVLMEYKAILDKSLDENGESVRSYYFTCDAIITSCQKELDKDNLSFDEKQSIIEQMTLIARMKSEKDSENKRFILSMAVTGLVAVGTVAAALLAALGGLTNTEDNDYLN